jgi:hypothetical protein
MSRNLPLYGNIGEAYKHLKRDDLYEPAEQREDDDWVVVLFPETMVVRLFRSLEEVGNVYDWCIYRVNVYVKPEQLSAKHTAVKLAKMCERAGIDIHGKTPLEQSRLLWVYCQTNGDRVTHTSSKRNSLTEHDEDTYTIRVDLLHDPLIQALIGTMPRQAQVIAENLREDRKTIYTETELEKFAGKLVQLGKLTTKQDPFRVVRYYAPTLADIGVMAYSARRKKDEARI